MRFLITIYYREPTYELVTGRRPEQPYHWTYKIDAATEERASALALNSFKETARQSSVGWQRDIVRVEIRPAE